MSNENTAAERDRLRETSIAGAFSDSRYVAERLTVPPDIARARFGASFVVENGVVMGKHADGRVIVSRNNPGVPAPFDEAIEIIIENYPHRDRIMRATGAAAGGNGKSITRAAFDALDAGAKMSHIKGGGAVHD